MKGDKNIKNKKNIDSNNQLYIELALAINKQMYDDNEISYNIFKITEDTLLKKVKGGTLE